MRECGIMYGTTMYAVCRIQFKLYDPFESAAESARLSKQWVDSSDVLEH